MGIFSHRQLPLRRGFARHRPCRFRRLSLERTATTPEPDAHQTVLPMRLVLREVGVRQRIIPIVQGEGMLVHVGAARVRGVREEGLEVPAMAVATPRL